MAAKITGELVRSLAHHHVTLDHKGVDKEQVHTYVQSTWRGQPVLCTFEHDRYRHSSGMSEWRTYLRTVDVGTYNPTTRAVDDRVPGGVTETARARLRDALESLTTPTLEGEAYRESYGRAVYAAIRRELRDTRGYSDPPTAVVRRHIEQQRGHLTSAQVAALSRQCDSLDCFWRDYDATADL